MSKDLVKIEVYNSLQSDISKLISESRHQVAQVVNSTIVMLYWAIGKRINEEILKDTRAEYGKAVILKVSKDLTKQFGQGYSQSNLFRMARLARFYPDKEIFATLSRKLSWSHFILITQEEDSLKRDFYIQMAITENWSIRTTKEKINSMLFERTALSKKPEDVIKYEIEKFKDTGQMTPDLFFKDPCFLDFIGQKQKHTEAALEQAILDHMVDFIQELGAGFCFVDRQKRMSTNNTDRYLDLLFYHRGMRRLVAIELKLCKFEPSHKGQMEWYLKWLSKNEKLEGEEEPIGIILCADKDQEDVEYMELDKSGIHVSQYLTELLPKDVLEEKLHKAIALANQENI